MTVKSRTIDNLGIDASIRYAQDQDFYEARYIEESRLIPKMAEISISTPFALSEFDQLFSIGQTNAWALFSPPPNYFLATSRLFSYQLIPSLGGYEKIEADQDKLENLSAAFKKIQKDDEESNDQERKDDRARKRLLALLQCINQLDKTLSLINSRRNQYHRG